IILGDDCVLYAEPRLRERSHVERWGAAPKYVVQFRSGLFFSIQEIYCVRTLIEEMAEIGGLHAYFDKGQDEVPIIHSLYDTRLVMFVSHSLLIELSKTGP